MSWQRRLDWSQRDPLDRVVGGAGEQRKEIADVDLGGMFVVLGGCAVLGSLWLGEGDEAGGARQRVFRSERSSSCDQNRTGMGNQQGLILPTTMLPPPAPALPSAFTFRGLVFCSADVLSSRQHRE